MKACALRPFCAALIIAAAVLLVTAIPSLAADSDGKWSGDFSIPAFDVYPQACAVFRGQYVVGGAFHFAAGVPVSGVAAWTGSEWTPLGGGLPSPVRRLAVQGTRLLAGTESSYPNVSPVMQFDGSSWNPLGVALYGQTDALLVSGNSVFAAGLYYKIGSTTGYRVMGWTGADWVPVGGLFDNRVRALAMHGGELYAGGEFLNSDGGYVSRLARWDGVHWVSVGGGTGAGGSGANYIAALASYGGRLIAGGSFSSMGGNAANGIAAWDGGAWSALPNTPVDVRVSDLEVEGSGLHVAGLLQVPNQWAAGLATFDGESWSPPSTYPGWSIDDVATGDGTLIAVGNLANLGGSGYARIRDVVVRDPAWHDLESWKTTMRGLRGPYWTAVNALQVHGGSLFAGGYFLEAANPPGWETAPGIARWDGNRWRALPGGPQGWISELTSWNGLLVSSCLGSVRPVMAWDGTSWADVGARLEGVVLAFTVWDGALIAAGSLRIPGAFVYSGVMMNRGAGWELVGPPLVQDGYPVEDVAVFDGELYAAGRALDLPGTGVRPLLRWDGRRWNEVPGTPLSAISCLKTFSDGLWMGSATLVGSLGTSVWRWNGREWSGIGDLPGPVYTFGDWNGQPFAATYPNALARWNGTNWIAVPDAPNRAINALAEFDGALFVGGSFTDAGGHAAEAIARWVPTAPPQAKVAPLGLFAGPNPASDRVTLRFNLSVAGRVQLSIYDLRGALIAKPVDEVLPAGTIERHWSAHGTGGAPPGVYFAKLVAPEGESVVRIAVIE